MVQAVTSVFVLVFLFAIGCDGRRVSVNQASPSKPLVPSESTYLTDELEKHAPEPSQEAAFALLAASAVELTQMESPEVSTPVDVPVGHTSNAHFEAASALSITPAELTQREFPEFVDQSAMLAPELSVEAASALLEASEKELTQADTPEIVKSAEDLDKRAPEPPREAASAPLDLSRNESPEIAVAVVAIAEAENPNVSVHPSTESLISSALVHVSDMAFRFKAVITSKQPSAGTVGDPPVGGMTMHVQSLQELLREARRDPLSPKVFPILISGGLAVLILLCMCCPCYGKQARTSRHGRDGGRRKNNRFTQRSSSPLQCNADSALSSSGSARDVRSGTPACEERSPHADGSRAERSKLGRKDNEDPPSGGGSSASFGSGRRSDEKAEAEAALLEQIEELAGQTSRTVQKYPKSGRSLFSKNRHVAAVPAAERVGVSSSKASDPRRIIQRWRNGTFGWWENEEALTQGLDPKGSMDLMAIVKVQTYKDDKSGRGVVIRYNAPNEKNEMEPSEMVLMFPTKRDADEWGYSLWSFLSKLRTRAAEQRVLE